MKIGLHASRFHTCRGTCSWAQTVRISPWHNSRSRGQCLIGIVITDCKRSATSFQIQTGSGSCSMVNDLLTNDKDLSCRCGNELTREPIFSLFSSQISPPLPPPPTFTQDFSPSRARVSRRDIFISIISINCFLNPFCSKPFFLFPREMCYFLVARARKL